MEEKKKGMSPILIVILTIIGICLVGFCVWYGVNYFKGEEKPVEQPSSNVEQSLNSETNKVENNSCDDIKEPENYIENDALVSEFSKIHKFVYVFFLETTYCGEGELQVVEDIDNPNDDAAISKQFKSYDELLDYLKKYMSIAVINRHSNIGKENYYVKDGKLYCKLDSKGWLYGYESSKVNIISLNNNKAETRIIVKSINEWDVEVSELLEYFNATFEKVDGNWVITKYKEIE